MSAPSVRWWQTWGHLVHQLLNGHELPEGHSCRDCPGNGGIGFDCHHLVRGIRVADHCEWCQNNGHAPGDVLHPTESTPSWFRHARRKARGG